MRLPTLCLVALLAFWADASAAIQAPAQPVVEIAYDEFTLGNGLRVIVHTDRKAPVIAVNLWYHVGSKDEPAGRSGFAHLYEHLMFQGSEHNRGEYFDLMEQIGAVDRNGTTDRDRTAYFETVPTTALDAALFMESDRMGHLLGAIDQAQLDAQREVVKNEKRARENQPYGRSIAAMSRAIYPSGHPYQHPIVGSLPELDRASLADVKAWFRSWYGPNNATLVLAGDIDLPTAKVKVARYFGDIVPSATLPTLPAMIAQREQSTRETVTDTVTQTRIMQSWNVPPFGDADIDLLRLFAQVFGGSNASRLDRRLVFTDPLVDSVSSSIRLGQLGSTFLITADVRDGIDTTRVEQEIAAELARLLADGPTPPELTQAKVAIRSSIVSNLEKVGGFGGKANVLNQCATFTGDPGCLRAQLARLDAATARDVRDAGQRWLARGDHTLVMVKGAPVDLAYTPVASEVATALPSPDPRFHAMTTGVDRRRGRPTVSQYPPLVFPSIQRTTLSNGMTVLLAERHGVPTLQLRMDFPGGISTDAIGKHGTADFATRMLTEGTANDDALALRNRLEGLGAFVSTRTALDASLDVSGVSLSALSEPLDPLLALYADIIRRPRFDAADIERVRAISVSRIRRENSDPGSVALRLLLPELYGPGHPYSMPFDGRGDEAAIGLITRADLVSWHRQVFRPDVATLLVSGDTSLAEIVPLLEKHFGDWRASDAAPPPTLIPLAPLPDRVRVFLVDAPGTDQSTIATGQRIEPTGHPQTAAFDIANAVLGGAYDENFGDVFSSRLNLNLREDKHWSYGAFAFVIDVRGQRPWVAEASVETARTAESIVEIQREISDMVDGRRPVSAADVARIQAVKVRVLPGAFETNRAVLDAIGDNRRLGRPDDDVSRRQARIEAITPADAQAAVAVIDPKALTWVIVGDLSKIEAGVRALNLGEVTVVDADGKAVASK